IAVADLARGEHTLEEAVAVAGKSVGDARNFRDVDARAYDHERYVSTMARQAATALLLCPPWGWHRRAARIYRA
ncbi:MAG TPA: hypothetical protein VK513_00285, partial [Terriglobales bacterium]|nr:hypothetical protein [Terriglobales bacterium]